jgi:hypothetical protein
MVLWMAKLPTAETAPTSFYDSRDADLVTSRSIRGIAQHITAVTLTDGERKEMRQRYESFRYTSSEGMWLMRRTIF